MRTLLGEAKPASQHFNKLLQIFAMDCAILCKGTGIHRKHRCIRQNIGLHRIAHGPVRNKEKLARRHVGMLARNMPWHVGT